MKMYGILQIHVLLVIGLLTRDAAAVRTPPMPPKKPPPPPSPPPRKSPPPPSPPPPKISTASLSTFKCAAGKVTTAAGNMAANRNDSDGQGSAAVINNPGSMFFKGGFIFVATNSERTAIDSNNDTFAINTASVKKINTQSNFTVQTVYTVDPSSSFTITGLVVDDAMNIYISCSDMTIRKIAANSAVATVLAGQPQNMGGNDGNGSAANFNYPSGLAIAKNQLYVADVTTIRQVDPVTGRVKTISGAADNYDFVDGSMASASYDSLNGLFYSALNDALIITESVRVRTLTFSTGMVKTVAGDASPQGIADYVDGPVMSARFSDATAAWAYDVNDAIFVADSGNFVVRKISAGNVATFAGFYDPTMNWLTPANGDSGTSIFGKPQGIVADPSISALFIADSLGNAIRQVSCI